MREWLIVLCETMLAEAKMTAAHNRVNYLWNCVMKIRFAKGKIIRIVKNDLQNKVFYEQPLCQTHMQSRSSFPVIYQLS